MSKKVTKMNQEAENQEMMDNKQETEEVVKESKLKAFGKKALKGTKKAAPILVGAAVGYVLCKVLGNEHAEKVMDNITALPDHGSNDFTGIDMTVTDDKTE